MIRSRVLKAIHVVGYLTTVIVIIEVAGLGYLSLTSWSRSLAIETRFREATRTRPRALGAKGANILEDDAAKSYAPVRPSTRNPADVVGFVSMPSFTPWFAVSMRLPRGATVATGEWVSIQHDDRTARLTISPIQTFNVPRAAFLEAVQQVDTLTAGWAGSGDSDCNDGVQVAFERNGHGLVTSGIGNASCDPHYAALERIFTPLLARFGPKATTIQ